MRENYSITELCQALGVSSSGYYERLSKAKNKRFQQNGKLLQEINLIHSHHHTRCYGSPRMTRELRNRGQNCSENRVARMMRIHGLRARPRRPYRPKTTRVDHAARPSPNLLTLAETPQPKAPGLQIVSDITYIPTQEGWLYLAIIVDLYSRMILGWKLSDSLHAPIVTDALQRALNSRLVAPNAIFHSDRGSQYSAASTRALIKKAGLRQSMSAAGYCYDNAYAESVFASIKSELPGFSDPFPSKHAARSAIFDYLETFYNRNRLHSSLGYRSPNEFLHQYFKLNFHDVLQSNYRVKIF
jgi:transposase InsO family protein